MKKRTTQATFITLLVLILFLPALVQGQNIDITLGDGQIDPIWSSVPALIENDLGYGDEIGEIGILGDIVNAWVVFDSPDPDTIYFRVDGYSIEDVVSVEFDCDGDLAFTSEIDRAILFEANDTSSTSDSFGTIDGFINYTSAYIEDSDEEVDLYSLELAQGEYVILTDEDDNELIQIEAILDLSGTKKFTGDMATCFGSREEGNWAIAYRYDSVDEQTPITTQQVRTAVEMRNQEAVQPTGIGPVYFILLLLLTMTFSLLILRRNKKRFEL